ncbi:MAG: hypothetical protein WA709_09700 [Stellaceae bacterium]
MMPVEERKPKKDWRTSPIFTDITRDACAFLEAACNVRYFEHEQVCKDGDPRSKTYGQTIDRWTSTHSVLVKPVARHFGNCGVAEYVIADVYDTRDFEYLKRCGTFRLDGEVKCKYSSLLFHRTQKPAPSPHLL